MNEEERKILYETAERAKHTEALAQQTAEQTREMHDAFFGAPADGEPPLIRRIIAAVVMIERGSWGSKVIIQSILGLAALMAAIAVIRANASSWWTK